MTYTIDDVKRLLPEATDVRIGEYGGVDFLIDGWGFVSELAAMKMLLDARRQLELARDGLEKIRDLHGSYNWYELVSIETIARMEEVK